MMGGSWAPPRTSSLSALIAADARPATGPMQRWDGAARTCCEWDGLHKDPELWLRGGDCLVYLYGRGQSQRGPSFQVCFKELVRQKCIPLIDRFTISDGTPLPRNARQLERWAATASRPIKLYIPPPDNATTEQAFAYHIATRNFMAWVFRRSLVGEHLGSAIVALMYSMHEFRSDDVEDHAADVHGYLDEEGYLDLVNQPNHALGLLYYAETFRIRDMYIRALAHCVGMSDRLHACPGYPALSLATKNTIRQSRVSLDDRQSAATDMLSDLLDEELSEAQLGIPAAMRAHLDRFRSYLMSMYTNRLGYYPPRAFDPRLCRTMRDEFESLYHLLVDYAHPAAGGLPSVASGGLCTLQLVNTFDASHRYAPLDHPLPLLPDVATSGVFTFAPWRARADRMRSDKKLLAHAALLKASHGGEAAPSNELVRAYRTFEEQSIFLPNKADKLDKVSLVDGRKVRWILVYAVYQVLRSITNVPPEVYDAAEAPYHVAIGTDTDDLVPWAGTEASVLLGGLSEQNEQRAATDNTQPVRWADSAGVTLVDDADRIEIKPDIDYLALNHRESQALRERNLVGQSMSTGTLARASSVKTRLSRNSTVRRSLRMFRPSSTGPFVDGPSSPSSTSSPKPTYHEIMVQGYGNGLNSVSSPCTASPSFHSDAWHRNNSTASKSSASDSVPGSTNSGDTVESSLVTPTSEAGQFDLALDGAQPRPDPRGRQAVSMIVDPSDMKAFASGLRRTGSFLWPARRGLDAKPPVQLETRRISQPPITVRDDWAAMQAFMDGVDTRQDDAWEQYASIGGLTEM
ncbi:uncharacterized protein F5Z01DRAFT_455939 [Emericellopsis atlantica]|uniref:DUF8004 domain-containing protein n=1 Tax=Emericellopsis atlantica TaxID=2614577 RepID=A0A9P7ZRS6_9HYPO|nr:uncharacterized protein F5Z01DRAFT_455939 [Emericellopsis atlantica]KAG9257153.1 hypothetical protein F5Z01DRAFT_455939 [Emericellopsis atlantica]